MWKFLPSDSLGGKIAGNLGLRSPKRASFQHIRVFPPYMDVTKNDPAAMPLALRNFQASTDARGNLEERLLQALPTSRRRSRRSRNAARSIIGVESICTERCWRRPSVRMAQLRSRRQPKKARGQGRGRIASGRANLFRFWRSVSPRQHETVCSSLCRFHARTSETHLLTCPVK